MRFFKQDQDKETKENKFFPEWEEVDFEQKGKDLAKVAKQKGKDLAKVAKRSETARRLKAKAKDLEAKAEALEAGEYTPPVQKLAKKAGSGVKSGAKKAGRFFKGLKRSFKEGYNSIDK